MFSISYLIVLPDLFTHDWYYKYDYAVLLPQPKLPLLSIVRNELRDGNLKEALSDKIQDEFGKDEFALSSPYGHYLRELFFHIPFLIADALESQRQFADAKRWYQMIFNPFDVKGQYWKYSLFRDLTDDLDTFLTDNAANLIFSENPFNPDAIAQLRQGAYEKAVVMGYIDNLLKWGDDLFSKDTWEDINQATILYVMAWQILGPRPLKTDEPKPPENEVKLSDLNIKQGSSNSSPYIMIYDEFKIPENDYFSFYWDMIEDRLYKIRHCMNIKGIIRELPLFQPPINPNSLITIMADGKLSFVGGESSKEIPHYRFTSMIERARRATSDVIQLGNAILSAIEKQDAEKLAVLRNNHEKTYLATNNNYEAATN